MKKSDFSNHPRQNPVAFLNLRVLFPKFLVRLQASGCNIGGRLNVFCLFCIDPMKNVAPKLLH